MHVYLNVLNGKRGDDIVILVDSLSSSTVVMLQAQVLHSKCSEIMMNLSITFEILKRKMCGNKSKICYFTLIKNKGQKPMQCVYFFRVYNYELLTLLRNLRANCYGKYISLRGTVVRVSNVKPVCTRMAFTCNGCGDTQSLPLPDGKYTIPTKVMYNDIAEKK